MGSGRGSNIWASPIKKTLRATEQDRPDIKQARQLWEELRKGLEIKRLIFIDESGLNTKMTRLHGRAPRGERCFGSVPHGHWKSFTFIAALRHDRLSAPWLLDGPMDGESFRTYIAEVLCPELEPGDVVILDNLACHKVAGVAEAIAKRGARLLPLPAYSPDLNPIEMAFAKLKAHLRKAATRSFERLLDSLKKTLNSFTPSACSNFFAHAGYATM